jgi:hypothetical protein
MHSVAADARPEQILFEAAGRLDTKQPLHRTAAYQGVQNNREKRCDRYPTEVDSEAGFEIESWEVVHPKEAEYNLLYAAGPARAGPCNPPTVNLLSFSSPPTARLPKNGAVL